METFDLDRYFEFVERNQFIPEPPKERIYIGDGAFRQIGCAVAKSLIREAGLAHNSAVLDIGSGIGRVALPLTQWLSPEGRYLGIEIVTEGVAWCIEHITAKYPNFRFVHADLQNDYYNPSGQGSSVNFKIPAELGTFDVAVFASVFTHLDGTDSDAWLKHTAAALKPGGRVWGTWFIMDDETIQNCRAGRTTIGLGYEEDGVFWQTPERNPGAVGYAPWKMKDAFGRHGLKAVSWQRGSWCEREKVDGGYQDLVVLQKE